MIQITQEIIIEKVVGMLYIKHVDFITGTEV